MSSNIPPPPNHPPEFPGPVPPEEPPERPSATPASPGDGGFESNHAAGYAAGWQHEPEPAPLPTMTNPKGPRQPGRDKSVSRTGVIVAAIIVFALLAGGAVWAVSAWTGRNSNAPAQAAPSASSTPTHSKSPTKTPSPTPTDPEKAAAANLKKQTKADTATAKNSLRNKWVPQVSSKRKGMKSGDKTWTDKNIWADFRHLHSKYPDALLLRSSDWKSFRMGNFWVTVINKGYDNPDDALAWCRANGLDGEHCYAKRLSNSHGPDSSSKH